MHKQVCVILHIRKRRKLRAEGLNSKTRSLFYKPTEKLTVTYIVKRVKDLRQELG